MEVLFSGLLTGKHQIPDGSTTEHIFSHVESHLNTHNFKLVVNSTPVSRSKSLILDTDKLHTVKVIRPFVFTYVHFALLANLLPIIIAIIFAILLQNNQISVPTLWRKAISKCFKGITFKQLIFLLIWSIFFSFNLMSSLLRPISKKQPSIIHILSILSVISILSFFTIKYVFVPKCERHNDFSRGFIRCLVIFSCSILCWCIFLFKKIRNLPLIRLWQTPEAMFKCIALICISIISRSFACIFLAAFFVGYTFFINKVTNPQNFVFIPHIF
ncbi:hypothetical protein RCL1_002642 [Eukaryota sp. TZLM3-RCL]